MREERVCDFCGRSLIALESEDPIGRISLKVDSDGLWACNTCRKRIRSRPENRDPDHNLLDVQLQPLVGKSAGAICRTLELPFVPPYDAVIEAASQIGYDQDLYMSNWLFVTRWQDGTTVWRAADGHARALVNLDGIVTIQES